MNLSITAKFRLAFFQRYYRPFSELPLHGTGVELGSREGYFASTLLSKPGVDRLYVVDPYEPYSDGGKPVTAEEQEAVKQAARRRLTKFGDRAIRVYSRSLAALAVFDLQSLDFVYIDADHSYDPVKADIAGYWSRLKHGGILGGHDFHPTWPGVVKAVTEFTVGNGLPLNSVTPDWWVVKP